MAGGTRKLDAVAVVDHMFDNFRMQLYDAGQRGLRKVRAALYAADVSGDDHLDDEELDEALRFCGLFASKLELASLFRMADGGASGRIPIGAVLAGIRGEMSDRRQKLSNKAWSGVSKGQSSVSLESVLDRIDADSHPDVVSGRVDADGFVRDVAESLAECAADVGGDPSKVTEETLERFHADLSAAMPADDLFVDWVEATWGVTEAALGREDMARLGNFRELVLEKTRQKKRSGESATKYLTRIFKFHDGGEDGYMTLAEFRRALETLGLPLSLRDARLFFQQYPRIGGGPGEDEEKVDWHAFRDEILAAQDDPDSGI